MLAVVLLLGSLAHVASAYWWNYKYRYNGEWYDCTWWDGGQWYFRSPSNERLGPCTLYSATQYNYASYYWYFDPYSYSYKRCTNYEYASDSYGSQYCGPSDVWWPYKYRDGNYWYDCYDYYPGNRWYYGAASSNQYCTDYHSLSYDWRGGYQYWDNAEREYYYCVNYSYTKNGQSYPCGQPQSVYAPPPPPSYTGPSPYGGGPQGGY